MQPDGATPAKVAALHAAERRHGWFDARLDGWSVWRTLRTPVYGVVSSLPLSRPSQGRLRMVLRALRASGSLLRVLIFARQCKLVAKTFRSGLRARQGERFRDVYVDGVLQRQPSSFKLEVVNSAAFDRQAALALRPPDLDAVVFTFWGVVLAKLRPRREAAVFCGTLAQVLRDEMQVDVPPSMLLRRASAVYWESRIYGLLIRRLRPQAVLVADAAEYALRVACVRHSVPFIELQHGVFDADHPDSVPDWVAGSTGELLLPDVFACYGRYWVERLAGTRQASGRIATVGNELIDAGRAMERRRERQDGELRLLVTSQGIDTARLAAWMAAALDACPPNLVAHLSIKLHPAYDADDSNFSNLLARPNVRLVAGSAMPNVWDLLAEADLHLSISSASHFDAVALGVPSVVIPLTGHYLMASSIDERSIFLAPTPAALWSVALAARPERMPPPEHYAVPGFVDNVERVIGEVTETAFAKASA